jgi:hypothetical protein
LKAYGDEFAGNGFVLKDQDAPRFFMNTGDDQLSLIRDFPMAVRLDGYVEYDSRAAGDADFTTPYLLKLLSGGSLGGNLAYYFYFYMNERGEVAGVEDAYIMFNDVLGSELDIYLGQFQVSDPLFKRELRLTFEDYQIYKYAPGESRIKLSYDRGIMLTYGFDTGTDIIAEIINGNGLGEADDNRFYDMDKYKSFAGRISQDLGDYFRVGGFGYYGKECNDNTSEVWLAGPDLTIAYDEHFELNLQYLERRDADPDFDGAEDDIESRGGMIECLLLPNGDRSRWYGVLLGNYVRSDHDGYRYRTISAHVGHLLRRNVRLVSELVYDMDDEKPRVVVGFVSAF